MQRLARALKALPADPDAGGILLPGERGQRESEARSRNGIPLAAATLAELQDLAQRLGVPMWH